MKSGSARKHDDVAKLLEIRSILQELETSGFLNIVYDLFRKVKNRVSVFLNHQDNKPSRPPLKDSLKTLFSLIGKIRLIFSG